MHKSSFSSKRPPIQKRFPRESNHILLKTTSAAPSTSNSFPDSCSPNSITFPRVWRPPHGLLCLTEGTDSGCAFADADNRNLVSHIRRKSVHHSFASQKTSSVLVLGAELSSSCMAAAKARDNKLHAAATVPPLTPEHFFYVAVSFQMSSSPTAASSDSTRGPISSPRCRNPTDKVSCCHGNGEQTFSKSRDLGPR